MKDKIRKLLHAIVILISRSIVAFEKHISPTNLGIISSAGAVWRKIAGLAFGELIIETFTPR